MHLVHRHWVRSNSCLINLFITMESTEGGGWKWHLRVTGYASAWGMDDPSPWPYPWILITTSTRNTRKESISFQAASGWWMRGSNEDQGKTDGLCTCIEEWLTIIPHLHLKWQSKLGKETIAVHKYPQTCDFSLDCEHYPDASKHFG